MVLGVVPDRPDPQTVVGRLAVHLGRDGSAGLAHALGVLVEATSLCSAVLRRRGGARELLAVAGDVVQIAPARHRDRAPVVELPVCGPSGAELAVLTVVGARPAALPVLRAATAVLGRAVPDEVPAEPLAGPDAAALLLDGEAAWAALADRLHDGPLQDLVAARYAADLAARTGDAALVREAVQTALVTLRRTLWQLRPRGADGLAPALRALSARLVESGAPALALDLEDDDDTDRHGRGTAGLTPVAAVAAYRLVQAASSGGTPLRVRLRTQAAPGGRRVVVLTVNGSPGPGVLLPDADRWRRTTGALGGDLLCLPGHLRLTLPLSCPAPIPAAVIGTAPTPKAMP